MTVFVQTLSVFIQTLTWFEDCNYSSPVKYPCKDNLSTAETPPLCLPTLYTYLGNGCKMCIKGSSAFEGATIVLRAVRWQWSIVALSPGAERVAGCSFSLTETAGFSVEMSQVVAGCQKKKSSSKSAAPPCLGAGAAPSASVAGPSAFASGSKSSGSVCSIPSGICSSSSSLICRGRKVFS